MSTALVLIGLFVLGILLNAFFAGYETGFVSSNAIRVRHMAENGEEAHAKSLLGHIESPDYLLTVVLIGTNIALMMGTIAITRHLGAAWATIIATPLFLIFGEIVPKSVFRMYPTRLSLRLFPVLQFFNVVLKPIALPTKWFSGQILRLVANGESPDRHPIQILMRSPEDMRILVDESADQGTIEPEEQLMIHSVMNLQTQQANEVMVPRIDIQALQETATRTELLNLLKDSGRTRIPIFRETVDKIIGVVNAFEVLRDDTPEQEDISRFVREVMHVPDTMKLDDILRAMRDEKQSMAIVTDEYGGTDGLITLEDILEEIFGEIQDEYDEESPAIRRVGPQDFVVQGRTSLEEASEVMGVVLSDAEVETVGGWLTHQLGRIPQKGEVLGIGQFRVTVLDGEPQYVSLTRIEVVNEKVDDHEQQSKL